jgi:hypothetical protein
LSAISCSCAEKSIFTASKKLRPPSRSTRNAQENGRYAEAEASRGTGGAGRGGRAPSGAPFADKLPGTSCHATKLNAWPCRAPGVLKKSGCKPAASPRPFHCPGLLPGHPHPSKIKVKPFGEAPALTLGHQIGSHMLQAETPAATSSSSPLGTRCLCLAIGSL